MSAEMSVPYSPSPAEALFDPSVARSRMGALARRVEELELRNQQLLDQLATSERQTMKLLDYLSPGVPMEGPVHVWLAGNGDAPLVAFRRAGKLLLPGGEELPEKMVLRTRRVEAKQ